MVLLAFNENYRLLSRCSSHVSFEILRESVRILSLALSTESDSRSNCRSCLFCSSCIPSARLLICCRTCPISAASASVTDLEFFVVLLLNWKFPLAALASSLLSVMNDRIIFGLSAIQAKRAGPCLCCENKSVIIIIAISPFPSGLDISLLQEHLVRGGGSREVQASFLSYLNTSVGKELTWSKVLVKVSWTVLFSTT